MSCLCHVAFSFHFLLFFSFFSVLYFTCSFCLPPFFVRLRLWRIFLFICLEIFHLHWHFSWRADKPLALPLTHSSSATPLAFDTSPCWLPHVVLWHLLLWQIFVFSPFFLMQAWKPTEILICYFIAHTPRVALHDLWPTGSKVPNFKANILYIDWRGIYHAAQSGRFHSKYHSKQGKQKMERLNETARCSFFCAGDKQEPSPKELIQLKVSH